MFWSKIDNSSDCWIWLGAPNEDGYGEFGSLRGPCYAETGETLVHRIAFVLHNGRRLVRNDEMVCHHCDIPPCVNPEHLYAGNARTNALDREIRSRRRKYYKLSEEQGLLLKKLYEAGNSASDLGHAFGISTSQAWFIATQDSWRKAWDVGRRFKSVADMVLADEREWREIPGVGKIIAQQVVKEINGK